MSERQKRRLAQKEANRLKRRMIEKVLSSTRINNAAFSLNLLVDGWLELESDPGTFSLLIEDFGCYGAQVDEIYDLEQKIDGPVLGFIFLFKWAHNQPNERIRSHKNNIQNLTNNTRDESFENAVEQKQWSYVEDENIISEMFFAKQMISNSCATHALISILLNCDYDKLNLGPSLTRLKEHTRIMDPENKGYAIGNLPELAKAHNSHASYSSLYNRNTQSHQPGMSYMLSGNQRTNLQQKHHEAYHFVSYVPINNRLYELDGLKNYPIDHGPFNPREGWTEKFRKVIKQRLLDNKTLSNEIRYNLMAVVPDKRIALRSRLRKLKHNSRVVEENMKRLSSPFSIGIDIPNPPYSPLSNGTITASERGSTCDSPSNYISSDDDDDTEKYFLIKFDHQKRDCLEEDNSEQAHKSCVIKPQPSTENPLDLSKAVEKGDKVIETKDLKGQVSNPIIGRPPIVQTFQRCSFNKSQISDKVNSIPAHGDEKYNLSKKPPLNFNILDNLQHVHFGKSALLDLRSLLRRIELDIIKTENILKEEIDKRRKYKIDNSRRTHNYEPFIMTFLSMMAQQGMLADLIEKDLGITADNPTITNPTPNGAQSITKLTPLKVPQKPAKTQVTISDEVPPKPRSRYKYVSTGRPVGRPRKYPASHTEKKDE